MLQSRAAWTISALLWRCLHEPTLAVKETSNLGHGVALDTENIVVGVSAMFWSVRTVVSLEYVLLIMRAKNEGQDGIMVLLAPAPSSFKNHARCRRVFLFAGFFGSALLR